MLVALQFAYLTSAAYQDVDRAYIVFYHADASQLEAAQARQTDHPETIYQADCALETALCAELQLAELSFPLVMRKETGANAFYRFEDFARLLTGQTVVLRLGAVLTGDHFAYSSPNCTRDDAFFRRMEVPGHVRVSCGPGPQRLVAHYGGQQTVFSGNFTVGGVKHFLLKHQRGPMDHVLPRDADAFVFSPRTAGVVVGSLGHARTFAGMDESFLYGYLLLAEPAATNHVRCPYLPCAFAFLTDESGFEQEWVYPLLDLEQFPAFVEGVASGRILMRNQDAFALYLDQRERARRSRLADSLRTPALYGLAGGLGAVFLVLTGFAATVRLLA
uniref:Uncharacterized protein n=1 Tax=Spironucleus salmonicida TaxID=348837 RepID=V6LT09_9EUKA|eukprot:EST47393.1 Hypothetical protein SS50377_12380 [Spironucleus salmonicida]